SAEELVYRMCAHSAIDSLPREVVLELTTKRATRAIFRPTRIDRADMQPEVCTPIFNELAQLDDARLTLAGVGDPLLCDCALQIIESAHQSGVSAIHLETDLLANADVIDNLAAAPIDVVSVHLPAMTGQTYQKIMGVDRLTH